MAGALAGGAALGPWERPLSDPARRADRARRRRVITVLKLALALALLGWVATRLPWRDTLLWFDGSESARALHVRGEIVGDWRGASIGFLADPREQLAAGWPAELSRAQAAGALLALERRALPQDGSRPVAGWDWRPGMPRVFREMRPGGLAAALLALVAGTFFGVTRWWRLLALARCPSSWWNTFRLTWLGLFFNLVVPGLTGGDLFKAVLVVHEHPERRVDALLTVVIDRMVGLWTLIALAAAVIWSSGGDFAPLRWPVGIALAAGSAVVLLALLSAPRRALGIERLIARLPQARRLQKLDDAAAVYAGRPLELPLSIALSLANHACVIAGLFAIGRAFGDLQGFTTYIGIVAVANTLTAVPLSPGGWGVGEAAYGYLFALLGAEAALGVAVSITYRLCTVALGLAGGVGLLLPGGRRVRSEIQADLGHDPDRDLEPRLEPEQHGERDD